RARRRRGPVRGAPAPRPGHRRAAAARVALLDDSRNNVGSANSYLTWTVAPDSVLRIDNGNTLVALKPGHARLTGRAPWDSTVALDVFVVGDLLVVAQHQGQRDLLMKW